MIVTVNGRTRELPDGAALSQLAELAQMPGRGTAAAVNGEVVPRSAWQQYIVPAGAAIELITAVQGG